MKSRLVIAIVDYGVALPFICQHEFYWNIKTNEAENMVATWIGVFDGADLIGALGIRSVKPGHFFINGMYSELDCRFQPTHAGKRAIHALQQIINTMPEKITGRVVLHNYKMLRWADRNGFQIFGPVENSMYVYRPAKVLAEVCH
jgi:hypothetical protein